MKPVRALTRGLAALALAATAGVVAVGAAGAPAGMVAVPGGPFVMGTDETDADNQAEQYGIVDPWFDPEHPAHKVTLSTYYIDVDEVTNGDYAAFVLATGRRPPDHWEGQKTPPQGLEKHPVTHVSWFDAEAYCRWNGDRTLPTEPQWEKAARGTSGQNFPWGKSFDLKYANVAQGHTTPVGSYPQGNSPYGVHDMTGNVWEWTADWYQAYPGNGYTSDKFGERYKVLRGNSWANVGHYPDQTQFLAIVSHNSRAAFRLYLTPNGRLNDVGFRCAKAAP